MPRRPHNLKDAARDPQQTDLEDFLDPSRRQVLQSEISAFAAKRKVESKSSQRPTPAPLDRYRTHLPAELEDAARQLLRLFLLAENSPRVTQAFDAAPKGRAREGLQAEISDAKLLLEKMQAEWPADVYRDILWFVAMVVHRADGTPMRLEDSGAAIMPGRSVEAQKWIGFGALYRSLQLAARFLARQRALGRKGVQSSTGDNAILQSTLKALAAQRKARYKNQKGS